LSGVKMGIGGFHENLETFRGTDLSGFL